MAEPNFGRIFTDHLVETTEPATPQVTSSRIVEQAVRMLVEYGCPHAPAIHAAAMTAYNDFVRPFDIPGVPNFVEPLLDRAIGEMLDRMLTTIETKVCG